MVPKGSSEVSVIGQRVTYHNGPAEAEEDRNREMSPLSSRPAGREPIRALRPAKGEGPHSTLFKCLSNVFERDTASILG